MVLTVVTSQINSSGGRKEGQNVSACSKTSFDQHISDLVFALRQNTDSLLGVVKFELNGTLRNGAILSQRVP